jgi:hypothetical protein
MKPAMASRVTLKAVIDELARLGHRARLEKASGYFYCWAGEASEWLDNKVRVAKVSDLTLDGWVDQFRKLKKLNAEIIKTAKAKRGAGK